MPQRGRRRHGDAGESTKVIDLHGTWPGRARRLKNGSLSEKGHAQVIKPIYNINTN